MIFAASIGAQGVFLLFGLLFIGVGIASSVSQMTKTPTRTPAHEADYRCPPRRAAARVRLPLGLSQPADGRRCRRDFEISSPKI